MSGLVIVDNAAPARPGPSAPHTVPPPSPTAEALAALWPQAKRQLYHPRAWWSHWRLRRSFNLRLIRHSEVRIKMPHGMIPDCAACTDLCCTGDGARVTLRLTDIARLKDAGLDAHIVHDAPVVGYASTVAEVEAQTSVFARTFPVLQRDATKTCTLLTADRACGAYPAWPVSCQRYPYSLDVLRREVFWAKGCGSRRAVRYNDAPDAVRTLVDAAVDAYNEHIKDMVMLYTVPEALQALDLLRFLNLDAPPFRGVRRRIAAMEGPRAGA